MYTHVHVYGDTARGISTFIITLETCIDALVLRARDAYSTGFLGDNKSPYKPPFHCITYGSYFPHNIILSCILLILQDY